MTRVLVADDDKNFLPLIERILKDAGYDVLTARNPAAARQSFRDHRIDVALIDYRLSDSKEGDESGLDVARTADPLVPKIIMSNKAQRTEIMRAIRTSPDGHPIAVAFLSKDDIDHDNPTVFNAIDDALKTRRLWTRQAREAISPELHWTFRSALFVSRLEAVLHVLMNAVFAVLMVWATATLHAGALHMALFIGGLVSAEIANVVLAHKMEPSRRRADLYHEQLLQSARFEQLLRACDVISATAEADRTKADIIQFTTREWLSRGAVADEK